MSSWCESTELKVTKYDKTEEEAGIKLPDISYIDSFEQYYPQILFSWAEQEIKLKGETTTLSFSVCHYTVLAAIMENLEKILVDGRKAPYEGLFRGHYLSDGDVDTKSYLVKEVDNETGKLLFEKEIDTMPGIVHDVRKYEEEHLKKIKPIFSKEKLLELMEINPAFYSLADVSLKEDEDLAFKAVKDDGENYKHLLEKYKDRRDFQLAAYISDPSIAYLLPKERLSDYVFLLEACEQNNDCFDHIMDEDIKARIKEQVSSIKNLEKIGIDPSLPF